METVNSTLKLLAPALSRHFTKTLGNLRRAILPKGRDKPGRSRSEQELRAQNDYQRYSAKATVVAYGGFRYMR